MNKYTNEITKPENRRKASRIASSIRSKCGIKYIVSLFS